ncbi:MAG: YeeE/YedE family protein [Flavobacteriales bacterium]|jgi:uncharacterized membrane protein YedE/YeeE|tara:strand:- start:414 stop:977 length:564 start_codon:yes stop_codon:yes gene_type:complete
MDWLFELWPWYISGPAIGLIVPILLIIGNKQFGVSSSLVQICSVCLPLKNEYFKVYSWKENSWNLVFILGTIIGGSIAGFLLMDGTPMKIAPETVKALSELGLTDFSTLMPQEVFSWSYLLSPRTLIMGLAGGFLVGFGARYAGGCTSGHAIMGLSQLSIGSLVAVIGFFIGGLIMTFFILPHILTL